MVPAGLLLHLFLIINFALFASLSLAKSPGASPSTPVAPGTACSSIPTLYPDYCKSVLSNQTANVFDHGRFCVRKSISQSQNLLNLVNQYLSDSSLNLSPSAIGALEDCRSLVTLNIEYLTDSLETVQATNQTLPSSQAEDVHTSLSAISTNLQTCQNGLDETGSSLNDLVSAMLNDTKLFSVSLAFYTTGWVPNDGKKKASWHEHHAGKKFPRIGNGSLPGNTTLWGQRMNGMRRLLQTDGDTLLISDYVIVSKDGSGNFTTVNESIAAVPKKANGTNGYFLIYIAAGIYNEVISIPKEKTYLLMVGDGINQTIITGNLSVVDGSTTFNSATFAVVAPNFVASGITFRNTAGAIKQQAVAVRNGADLSVFYSCSFEGYQDTLYTHSMRQFYRECDIYGTVDYIFGNAAVVLQDCNIYPRLPTKGQYNTITAQGKTDPNMNTGTSIQNCTITPAQELVFANYTVKTYLGRPWKNYSTTVVMQSYMDGFIDPAGWHEWSGDFALSTLYYGEYNNTGPGSNTTGRVTWAGYHVITNSSDAANFTVANLLQGDNWIPNTGVPYTSGFV